MSLRPLSRRSARFTILHRSSPLSSRGHPHQHHRRLTTTQSRRGSGSPLFQLAALSNSRENRWLSKASGIGHIEFSPQLQLIRSSEVLPMQDKAKTIQSTAKSEQRLPKQDTVTSHENAPSEQIAMVKTPPLLDDTQALALGRQLLKSHHESIARLERRVDAQIRLLAEAHAKHAKEREGWMGEKRKLERDNRTAAGAIVAAIAVATGIAIWTYRPSETAPWNGPKRPFGQQIGTSTRSSKDVAKPVEVVETFVPSAGVPLTAGVETVSKPIAVTENVQSVPIVSPVKRPETSKQSWSSFFWSR